MFLGTIQMERETITFLETNWKLLRSNRSGNYLKSIINSTHWFYIFQSGARFFLSNCGDDTALC